MNLYTQKKVNKNTNFLTKKNTPSLTSLNQSEHPSISIGWSLKQARSHRRFSFFFSASSTTKQQRVDCCVGAVSLGQALLIFFLHSAANRGACVHKPSAIARFFREISTDAGSRPCGRFWCFFSFFIIWLTVFVACCWAVIGSGSDLVCCFFFRWSCEWRAIGNEFLIVRTWECHENIAGVFFFWKWTKGGQHDKRDKCFWICKTEHKSTIGC